jgi:predicted helicase
MTDQRDPPRIFRIHSLGLTSNRDSVVYDFNRGPLVNHLRDFIEDYNGEVDRYKRAAALGQVGREKDKFKRVNELDGFVRYDRSSGAKP